MLKKLYNGVLLKEYYSPGKYIYCMSIIMYFITNDTSTKLMYAVYICILMHNV